MAINCVGFKQISDSPHTDFKRRIVCELDYLIELSEVNGGMFDAKINSAIDFLCGVLAEHDVILKTDMLAAEKMLADLSAKAKEFEVICVAHAHIDMNWMWRYDETVNITLATFRTMLDLLKEYPTFTFGQSQASVYRIVEKYDPAMLDEIKEYVKQGRWEVTASTWVETDKNMPNGESLARHILYTKKYLSKTFDIPEDRMNMDFEPDTFGHNLNVPEILCNGGVKYYYHCRGFDGPTFFKWQSPSGKEILVYKELRWYNDTIEPQNYKYVPKFASQHKIKKVLSVYGVGDHGGGATRKDLSTIIAMNEWPLMPTFRFGTYNEFYSYIDSLNLDLPVITDELNFVFTGCYTTQTRIKEGNRTSEALLNEAEMYATFAGIYDVAEYSSKTFGDAWEGILFNHFHDILPGSGTVDTREYSRGLFQEVFAIGGTQKNLALSAMANNINNAALMADGDNISFTNSEGAGVGFGLDGNVFGGASRGAGKNRIFTYFNSSSVERETVVETTVWDWYVNMHKVKAYDYNGNELETQLINHSALHYWGHMYYNLLVKVKVPAFGYTTVVLKETVSLDSYKPFIDHRVHGEDKYFLENEFIKVDFDTISGSIISLFDKKHGKQLISRPSGYIRYIEEDAVKGMTAWTVGRYSQVTPLVSDVKVKDYWHANLRQKFAYEVRIKNSHVRVEITLDKNSPSLNFKLDVDWREIGIPGQILQQLNFFLPFDFECENYKYDIPFGTIVRKGLDLDVPGNSFAYAKKDENSGLLLVTKSKYGFRCKDNSMAVTLIRSSVDPDPYPEFGKHTIELGIIPTCDCYNSDLIDFSYNYNHKITAVSTKGGNGKMPMNSSFMTIENDNISVSAIKMPENGKKEAIIRLYETEGEKGEISVKFGETPKNADIIDINENVIGKAIISGNNIKVNVDAYSICTLQVKF